MIFNENAIISDIYAYKTVFKKAKMQSVGGRIYHSLSLRLSGSAVFDVDGRRFLSGAGDITFMPAGVHYNTAVPEEGEMLLIHFRTVKNYNGLSPAFFSADGAEVRTLFSQLCDSFTTDGDHGYKCMALFYSLLDAIDRPSFAVPKRMRVAKNHIDKNYAEPLSVAALAYTASLSEVHFRNEFKKYFGLSPLSYIKKVRIDNARHLLRTGFYSVTDVALMCGFDSISYFSYEFKRLTGITPTDYIKKYEKG